MIVELTTTNIEILPELRAVNLTITPKFTSGGNIPTKTSQLENDSNFISDADYASVKSKAESALQEFPDNLVIDSNYVHTDNNLTNDLALEIGKVAGKQDSTDIGLNTTNKNIVSAINEVRGLALEIPIGLVFATKETLDLWLTDSENKASIKNAQNLYIIDTNTPDYWWDFSAQAYHEIQTKIDLSGYLTAEQIALAYQPLKSVLELYVSQTEKDTWNGKQNTLTLSTDIEADKASTTKISAIKTFYDWAIGLFAPKVNPIFSGVVKATKIAPNSDSTGLVIRNAADTADVVKVDTVNKQILMPNNSSTNRPQYSFADKPDYGMLWDGYSFCFYANNSLQAAFNETQFIINKKLSFGNAQYTPAFEIESGNNNVLRLRDSVKDIDKDLRVRSIISSYWVYLNNGTHTGDAVGDKRFKITSGVLIYERCTVLHATRGSGNWVTDLQINAEGVLLPKQAASAPTYVKGGMYFDTTLNKMRIGGATGWETIQSL